MFVYLSTDPFALEFDTNLVDITYYYLFNTQPIYLSSVLRRQRRKTSCEFRSVDKQNAITLEGRLSLNNNY